MGMAGMTRALILCGGYGKRLGLKRTPKCMVKINKKPILEHLLDRLYKIGVDEVIVNVNNNHQRIFDYFGTRVLYFYEPVLLGQSGTEKMLKNWLGDRYYVLNGDTMSDVDLKQMEKMSEEQGGVSVYFFKERYGGVKFETGSKDYLLWDGDEATYFDCGTPRKLARARRELK